MKSTQDSKHTKDTLALERQIFTLKALIDAAKMLSTTLDVDSVLKVILNICLGQFLCSGAAILTPKSIDDSTLVLRYQDGYDDSLYIEISEESALFKHFAKNAKSDVIRSINNDSIVYPLFKRVAFIKDIDPEGPLGPILQKIECLHPTLIAVFLHKYRINGLLILSDKLTQEEYTSEEKEFLDSLTGFAAVAVENAHLYEMATQDRLTKLFNQHYFKAQLKEEMSFCKKANESTTLVMADIDHFKQVNDTYGHLQGDYILAELASVIKKSLPNSGLAARYGGEEFALIIPNATYENTYTFADQLRTTIQNHHFPGYENGVRITTSFGIAQFDPSHTITSETFIKQADDALYYSKRNGRNQVTRYDTLPS